MLYLISFFGGAMCSLGISYGVLKILIYRKRKRMEKLLADLARSGGVACLTSLATGDQYKKNLH